MHAISTLLIVVLFSLSTVLSQDQTDSSSSDDACIAKPCGPFVCQARCVASCLDTNLAPSLQRCLQDFCQDFGDNTPCPLNDTDCWKTCGFISSPDDPPAPSVPEDIRVASWTDGFSTANSNPKAIRLEWPSTKDATLYIIEAFPMFGRDPTSNNQHTVKNMTTETSFTLERADLCNVYMIRIMAVNGFGTSPPRYMIADAWKPELNFDENFDVHYIRREGDYVKVLIDFSPPESWRPGDVELGNSFVRAHDCLAPLDGDLFLSKQPDEDGYYTPVVFINQTESSIELSFPAKIMFSKCLYSYRLSDLQTLCNATVLLDTKIGAGVDFALNCLSVDNSDCPRESSENKDDSNPQNKTSSVDGPEAMKELSLENASETNKTDVLARGDSKEVIVVANPEAMKELEQENATTTSKPAKEASGEIAVVGVLEALKELEEENSGSTTPRTTNADKSKTVSMVTPPSPFSPDDHERPPAVVIVEPRDPSAPLCKLAEFDALADVETKVGSAVEENPVNLTISWLEDRPPNFSANPSHFLVRYGPIARTLVVDPQPEITDEIIVRTPDTSEAIDGQSRSLKVFNLIPNSLYAFQICGIYNARVDLAAAWDMAPRYMVDLSGAAAIWRSGEIRAAPTTSAASFPEQIPADDLDFVNSFINALNTSFNAAEAAADTVSGSRTSKSDDSDESTTTESKDDSSESATTASSKTKEESEETEAAISQINIVQQVPPVFNVDVKPMMMTDANVWSPVKVLWLILAMVLVGITASAFMYFILRHSRRQRDKKQKQFQTNAVLSPVYTTQAATSTTAVPEVKLPIA